MKILFVLHLAPALDLIRHSYCSVPNVCCTLFTVFLGSSGLNAQPPELQVSLFFQRKKIGRCCAVLLLLTVQSVANKAVWAQTKSSLEMQNPRTIETKIFFYQDF